MRFKEADGRKVVSAESAESIGRIEAYVIDTGARSVSAFRLAKVKGDAAQKDKDRIGTTKDWVFETKDCQKTYELFAARGVHFIQTPQKLPWGTQAIFEDLYGDEFVLLSHGKPDRG